MAKSNYIPVAKQEELIRGFVKTYSKYLDRSELDKNYTKQKGLKYLEVGVNNMMDKAGFYIFGSESDSKGRFRIALWIESNSDRGNDFYAITAQRWERFIDQFEKRNNVALKKYK